ncbi:MAG: flotillin family protein [Planctomycetaceae bacterium]|nr:flotillin family protein [Planctomycetales bacterium]MCB9938996.1 flotillin family protein [Planctomycetaceae bacterium]
MDPWTIAGIAFGGFILFVIAALFVFANFYKKVGPEEALIRSGQGGLNAVTGSGIMVYPVLHRVERMDLSVKRIEIHRRGEAGLICKDNIRADIEVAFFVRVNNTRDDILQVAQSLGCKRASTRDALIELFDAKFSEALKTVGKQFDLVELFVERDKFKLEILKVIGTDLNGYVLDDCAIDYLEQTPVDKLDPRNIMDAEGIKKITELTAREHIISNDISREKEKTIRKQDVEAREAILELDKQQAEAEEKQRREIAEISARERAQSEKVQEEERLKSEAARIRTEEEIRIAEENRDRQILVAQRNKERTDAVEIERVERDRMLEQTERERLVGVAEVEKEKAIEVERRNIQEVIRERVVVERAVVEEQERIKDTEAFAGAERKKKVTITAAEEAAQQSLVKEVKAAEASKAAATLLADQAVIEAEAKRAASEKQMQATKMLAEAKTADEAAVGLAEANVMLAKADAIEKHGTAEANVTQKKMVAEAKGQEAKAVAIEKEGTAEATVLHLRYSSEAKGIQEKAEAMKLFDSVGKEHEEFKLRLEKDKEIEIAAIQAQIPIAEAQSHIVGEAMKSARIDIVGGESDFFERVIQSVKSGKVIDRFMDNSQNLTDVKNTFFNGNPEYFRDRLRSLVNELNLSTDDIKDLSIAALIGKMMGLAGNDGIRNELGRLLGLASQAGLIDERVKTLKLDSAGVASKDDEESEA